MYLRILIHIMELSLVLFYVELDGIQVALKSKK